AGQALEFDGVDDYVSHPDNSDFDLGTGSLTATAWIKVKAEAPYTRMAIVGKKTNSNNIEGWKLRIQQSGDNESMHLQHSLSDGSTNVATTWFDSIDRDVWTHVIVVIDRDQDEVRIYKNGIEGESSDISDYSGDPITNGQPLRIGNQGTSAPFEGLIDDVRVYDRALSDDEITGLYNATKPFTENAPRNDQFTNGLVGYWSFDGPDVSGSTVDDVSGSSNDGTINGDASPAIGKIGQAFEFDGDGDYVDAGDSASLDLTSAITMSTWVNIDTVSVRHNIMSKYDTSGSQRAYAMDMNTENDGNVAVFLGSPDGTSFDEVKSNDGYLSANTWHHVIFTWSKNENGGNGRLFVDGEEVSYESQETKTDDMNTNNVSFKIARTYTTDRDYSGKIDDVRIYNRSLSADEVQRLYQMGR
ncbi:MAG: LamG domain-containing protein, partial [Candidatus Paceibacterota bacterium]